MDNMWYACESLECLGSFDLCLPIGLPQSIVFKCPNRTDAYDMHIGSVPLLIDDDTCNVLLYRGKRRQ